MNIRVDLSPLKELVTGYDLIILSDGSGCKWGYSIGWASILIERERFENKLLWGSSSEGTVNVAELIPFMMALRYHFYKTLKGKKTKATLKTLCISDSEHTVNQGNRLSKRTIHQDLWAAIDFFESIGYQIDWYWIDRCSNYPAELVDAIAGFCNQTCKTTISRYGKTSPKVKVEVLDD